MSIRRSLRSGSSQLSPCTEYWSAAASSPLAPPNCSRSMLPNFGSGVSTRTVYINCLTWWYMSVLPLVGQGCSGSHEHRPYRHGPSNAHKGGRKIPAGLGFPLAVPLLKLGACLLSSEYPL